MQEQAQAVLDNESKELILVGHAYVIAGEAGQIYRQYTNSDHGIDGEIEFKNSKGEAAVDRSVPPAQVRRLLSDEPGKTGRKSSRSRSHATSNTGGSRSTP